MKRSIALALVLLTGLVVALPYAQAGSHHPITKFGVPSAGGAGQYSIVSGITANGSVAGW